MPSLYGQQPGPLSWAGSEALRLYLNVRYGGRIKPLSLKAQPSALHERCVQLQAGDAETSNIHEIGLLLSSIRMGYGHHRIARAVITWADDMHPALLDLMSVDAPQSGLIRDMEGLYSLFSRLSFDIGGPMQALWNAILLRGTIDTLAISTDLAKQYSPLFSSLQKDLLCMASYPFAAQMAVAAGFTKVLNLIPDNHPQYYLLAPGARNVVQTESSCARFQKMGVPADEIECAGHFVPRSIAENVAIDAQHRIERRRRNAPLRCLLSLGGTGAQAGFLRKLIERILPAIDEGRLFLMINCGEHADFASELISLLEAKKIPFTEVDSSEGLSRFGRWHAISSDEPTHAVTIFRFTEHGLSVRATDELIRCVDLLVTRPAQVAYFPVPKVLLRRLADLEIDSSNYLVELDECDAECSRPEQAADLILSMLPEDGPLIRRNEGIQRRSETGLYLGARRAVEMARSL